MVNGIACVAWCMCCCCACAGAVQYVGAIFGRRTPWEVWGPSGETTELGTAAVIDGLRKVRAVAHLHMNTGTHFTDKDSAVSTCIDTHCTGKQASSLAVQHGLCACSGMCALIFMYGWHLHGVYETRLHGQGQQQR